MSVDETYIYMHEDCMYAKLDPDTIDYVCMAESEDNPRRISVYGCPRGCKQFCPVRVVGSSPKLELKNDPVNHPSHYTNGKYECIDVIYDMINGYRDPISAWLTGQIVKYIWRWPYKNGLEDLKKTRFYLDRLIEHEEKKDGE